MKQVFAKYNRERLPRFQTVTSIIEDNGNYIVRKNPLSHAAYDHLKRMYNYYENTTLAPHFKLPDVKLTSEGLQIEYIHGTSLDKVLFDLLSSNKINSLKKLLIDFKQRLEASCVYFENFKSGPEFKQTFNMDLSLHDIWCQITPNIDLIFDNIIVSNDDYYLVDAEWTYDFPLPSGFILFRCIANFSHTYRHYITKHISIECLWDIFGFQKSELQQYKLLEEKFQEHVFGPSRNYAINVAAKKEVLSLNELERQQMAALSFANSAKRLEEELLREKKLTADLSIQLQESREEVCLHQADVTCRDEQISKMQTDRDRIEEQLSELENRLNAKKSKIAECDEQIYTDHEQLNHLEQRLNTKRALIAERDERIRQIGEVIALEGKKIDEERAAIREERTAERRELAEMVRRISEMEQVSVERERRITDLLNSKSWKITAPLRRMLDLFSGNEGR